MKTYKPYLIVSVILFGITRVYGLFAHGRSSIAMESTALVALLGGLGMIFLKSMLNEKNANAKWSRFSYNVSLALLINHLFIQGVLKIAGGSSSMDYIFLSLSGLFGLMSVVLLIFNQIPLKKESIST